MTTPTTLAPTEEAFQVPGRARGASIDIAAAGYAVYAIDMRGRGKSSGGRFYIEDVSEYVGDLHVLIRLAKSRDPGPTGCAQPRDPVC